MDSWANLLSIKNYFNSSSFNYGVNANKNLGDVKMTTTIDLSRYGINEPTEILHNPSYETLFAEETKLRKDFLREEAILELQNAKDTMFQRQKLERDALQKEYDDKLIKEIILREKRRGGQLFYIYNNIATIETKKKDLLEIMPNLKKKILKS